MTTKIETIEHAAKLIGREATISSPSVASHASRVTSCGVHRDGRLWIGFGDAPDNGARAVVAPAIVFFLPVTITSLTPMVGAEGGAGCPVVVQAEPGLVVGGSPARASLDGRKARLAEALDPDGEGLFTDDPRGQT